MLEALVSIASATALFWALDVAISFFGFVKPYYAVHTLHNAAIVALTGPDIYAVLTDFHNMDSHPVTWPATYICFGLHLYHILKYWRTLQFDDWLHHGLMLGVALPIGCTISAGSLMGFNLFFTTGLPGGISYGLLFVNRNGWITKETEKAFSAPIHVWIRSPGCMAYVSISLVQLLSNPLSVWTKVGGFIIAVLTYWNGQYFMDQVVRSAAKQVVPLDRMRDSAAAVDSGVGRFVD